MRRSGSILFKKKEFPSPALKPTAAYDLNVRLSVSKVKNVLKGYVLCLKMSQISEISEIEITFSAG